MSGAPARLLIRADANRQSGTGHVIRCIALAEAWRNETGPVCFASRSLPPPVAARLKTSGLELVEMSTFTNLVDDAREFLELARARSATALVVDGYEFDRSWQQVVHADARPLLLIDDEGKAAGYHADLILNQNPYATAAAYREKCEARVLAGLEFALIRDEFLKLANRQSPLIGKSHLQLLVSLGGGGSELTLIDRVIEAIQVQGRTDLISTIVEPGRDARRIGTKISLVPWSDKMPELMRDCDFAVCGGGSTNWEMCLFGVPRAVIVLADNQRTIAQALESAGACINLGWHADVTGGMIATAIERLSSDASLHHSMREAGRRLVDGRGASRVCHAIRNASTWA